MGKATRIKRESAREKIAAQRAAARKAEIRNRIFITGGSILGVLVILAAFLIFKAVQRLEWQQHAELGTGTALPASVIKDLTTVPAATLESVGSGATYPKSVSPVSAPPLTSAGKPEVLYIGAEYCPYCATERWAMAVALSRFGTFSGLHGIHSSSTDVYASTPTLTFYKSRYTSKYLTFTPVEEETTGTRTSRCRRPPPRSRRWRPNTITRLTRRPRGPTPSRSSTSAASTWYMARSTTRSCCRARPGLRWRRRSMTGRARSPRVQTARPT